MADETTTEMLAEIEAQAEYTPPEGWRVVAVGEVLQAGDERVQPDESRFLTRQAGRAVQEHELYIRRIDEQPEPQPEKIITPDDVAGEALAGAINEWPSVQIVRREVEKLQEELGQAKRRIVELETLVADLRTINDAQEKTVRSAGRQNVDLQHRLDVVSDEWLEQAATCNGLQQQLEAVKAELVQQTETSRRLQIELDAREQVPTSKDDRFEEGWDAGTARAVETIAEWLQPLRKGNTTLRAAVFYHLPHIMRSLTGLTPED